MFCLLKAPIGLAVVVLLTGGTVQADTVTIGPNGINSAGLTDANGQLLTGAGISIGQVEAGRPGDADVGDSLAFRNTTTNPAGVFIKGSTAVPPSDFLITPHAQWVAGVMISTDATDGVGPLMNGIAPTGVATGASLYSSAFVNQEENITEYEDALLTIQNIATINGGNVRAINNSWGKPLHSGGTEMDGNSLLTLGLDWSASKYDVLHVVAGNQSTPAMPMVLPIPKDNFNGMTVGASAKVGNVYRQVASFNNYTQDAFGPRTSIDILAPGEAVELTGPGNVHVIASGTSFAAPHVTGTVALLQEYGDERIANSGTPSQWNANARRHEVMKAVLMNSADKLEDDGTLIAEGKLLGMEKTILDTSGDNWLASDAFSDSQIPLDDEMGTGQLNAKRALQQFLPGEFDSDTGLNTVPTIGWDYGRTSFDGDFNRYLIDTPLVAGDLISITLAWDRQVELTVDDGVFSVGDTFVEPLDPNTSDDIINDLDIFLVPLNSFTPELESSSFEGTVEHIFAQIPFDGEYEIWVQQQDDDIAGGQDYGLAWWYGLAPEIGIPIAGDFDGNGTVDGTDFLAWQRDTSIGSLSDWENNYGMSSAVAATTVVPEPTTCLMLATGLAFCRPQPSRNSVG